MARYIDVDVLNECMSIVQKANRDSIEFNKRCKATDVFHDIWGMIKAQPTADVQPVVRGEWMDKGSLSCRCSECGCKNNKETAFCPNCGAIMEGVK